MRSLTAAVICCGLCGVAAQAETPLSPEGLLDLLVGGSAVFTSPETGQSVGAEYFPSRNRSFWQGQDGVCSWGTVTLNEGTICFRYDDMPERLHCWMPFSDGDVIAYRAELTGEVQVITPVAGIAPGCADNLTS